ncbi:hypothetical protein [Breznakia pachnodae]|uniref:Uncharacterized protein n=1 Tax=Breznakia pachnodae TaxID=265178 RepID=A0ABU0E8M9_9FIRM|nr:hypothetical protein [Breznakia pachnodae]MDQ0363254.1 hypothetical protein [Breznakia pachnodae]
MATSEEIRKEFKFKKDTVEKIEKLRKAQELENPGIKIYSKTVVSDAIDLAYSAKFGKEVFQETMTRLELMISTTMSKLLLEHLEPYANALSNIYDQAAVSKEAMLLILVANNIVGNDPNVLANLISKNAQLEYVLSQAIEIRKENRNE